MGAFHLFRVRENYSMLNEKVSIIINLFKDMHDLLKHHGQKGTK